MNNIDFENRIAESRAFIDSCELGSCTHAALMNNDGLKSEVDEQSAQAFVANDSIVSIVAGMSKKNREDVKDCMLFASLAANKQFPAGGVEWYNKYVEVLGWSGWATSSNGLSKYKASKSAFTMEQEGLEILASAITAAALPGPTSLLLLNVAKDAIGVLQKNEKPLRIFETSSKKHNGAKFAISSAVESKDKQVVMVMAAMDFSTSLNVTNVLFWEWSNSSVSIKSAGDRLEFNSRHFDSVADVIRKKLTDSARQNIAEIEF